MDSLSETLDKALHIVKDKSAKGENDGIDLLEKEDCEMKLTNDCDQELESNESDKHNNVTLNKKSTGDSHETKSEINVDGIPNCSEKTSVDHERNTESSKLQHAERTSLDKDVEKHVSFKVDKTSDSDHVTTQESCDVSAKNKSGNSSEKDQSKRTETQSDRSSPDELDDNNSAFNTKDNMQAVIEQNGAKVDEQKQNGALNEVEDSSNIANATSALGKGKEFTIDSYVSDDSVNEESKMTEKELEDLHVRVDIFRFLLPGLCHLTSEDLPRLVLIKEGILALLDLYMWRQWNMFLKNPQSREVQVNN